MEFEKALQYVKNKFDECPEHKNKYTYRDKFEHTLRVFKWAKTLLETEAADANILLMAVIFHDVGYTISSGNHMQNSADICKDYLVNNNYSIEYIKNVCEVILNHDEKELLYVTGTTIEQILMIEADNLDESGAVSILRDVLAIGVDVTASYNSAYDRICNHSVSQQKIEKYSVTPTARKIWKQKLGEYNMFVSALERDLVN